jgi:hypothetical protein
LIIGTEWDQTDEDATLNDMHDINNMDSGYNYNEFYFQHNDSVV